MLIGKCLGLVLGPGLLTLPVYAYIERSGGDDGSRCNLTSQLDSMILSTSHHDGPEKQTSDKIPVCVTAGLL